MADAKQAVQQNHSGSEMSSSSTNGEKVTPSDTNANHETNDKFIFSSTSMEFAVSRKVGKYRQKNSSDDINGHKQTADVRNAHLFTVHIYMCVRVLFHSFCIVRIYMTLIQLVPTTSGRT